MAITASFSTSQTVGSPSSINLTDTSSGADASAVQRRIYIVTAEGQYLTESGLSDSIAYTNFPIADGNTITLDVLSQDMALYITLSYLNASNVVVATATNLIGFTMYNETYYYTLTQAQAQQNQPPPMIMQDSTYYMNKGILRTEIDAGNQAVELGADIVSAQACYDRATFLVTNANNYF